MCNRYRIDDHSVQLIAVLIQVVAVDLFGEVYIERTVGCLCVLQQLFCQQLNDWFAFADELVIEVDGSIGFDLLKYVQGCH